MLSRSTCTHRTLESLRHQFIIATLVPPRGSIPVLITCCPALASLTLTTPLRESYCVWHTRSTGSISATHSLHLSRSISSLKQITLPATFLSHYPHLDARDPFRDNVCPPRDGLTSSCVGACRVHHPHCQFHSNFTPPR